MNRNFITPVGYPAQPGYPQIVQPVVQPVVQPIGQPYVQPIPPTFGYGAVPYSGGYYGPQHGCFDYDYYHNHGYHHGHHHHHHC